MKNGWKTRGCIPRWPPFPSWLSVLVHGRIASLNSFVSSPCATAKDRWHRLHHGSGTPVFLFMKPVARIATRKALLRRLGNPICCLGFRFQRISDREGIGEKNFDSKERTKFVYPSLHTREYVQSMDECLTNQSLSMKFVGNKLKNKRSLTTD